MMALTLGLVTLTIALLGGSSTALIIPQVIIPLSLLTQQNDGAHAGPGNPDHRSPWRSVNSSNYSRGSNHPIYIPTQRSVHRKYKLL